MTERDAVATLLRTVDFLTPKQQRLMTEALVSASDEDVHSIGVFLAAYVRAEAEDLKRLNA
ncbi:MAG: hypothetical protein AAB776_01680 [Patescibacteria group bacterium]